MKKTIFFIVFIFVAVTANAQKFALIDMEYILEHIPAYKQANERLEQLSQKYQNDVDVVMQQAQSLYTEYQSKVASFSEEQRVKKEEEVIAKEKTVAELRRKYFGQEGDLFKEREKLMKPIQDDIYFVIKEIAEIEGFSLVTDRASASGIIFASPRIDISSKVLTKLGYSD
ncbi:hypothetical protein EZS27_013734 [termite gut metagenome]|uniref:Chaperone protein Skp n=1 Tax=termite gut metagenome TaxID=433724 RepID=A0A5J4RZ33_9ZZZZ